MPILPARDDSNEIKRRFRKILDSGENRGEAFEQEEELLQDGTEQDQGESEPNLEITRQGQKPEEISDSSSSLTVRIAMDDSEKPNSEGSSNIDLTKRHEVNPAEHSMDETRIITAPAIDEYGMPLPGRHEKSSHVSAFDRSYDDERTDRMSSRIESIPARQPQQQNQSYLPRPVRTPINRKKRRAFISASEGMGCVLRMFLLAVLTGIILAVASGSVVLYEYYKIAATLPSVADLQQRASTFETTRIFDRDGNLLYEILDPNAGRRTFITLDKISPIMVAATIATEDKSFYSHPGFDWTAIVRAFWQNFKGGGTVSGASTITQQLARNLLLSPEERTEQSYIRKVREALLAAEITRRYSKDEILELYLNEFYYGNLAYGVEAASETYFNITADKLDLPQASFLAGLPQAPSVYDVYNNREAVRERQKQVLTLMYEASNEQGCIYVSNSPQKVCVDERSAIDAYIALENYQFNPPDVLMRYPHWVTYVRSILESQFDAQTIYHSGFSVYTTLDPTLQDEAQRLVEEQIDALIEHNAKNGALIALKPSTGEILAMVGSADFYNDSIDGQVNMATSPTRQPGSAIKPITYIAAFEKGWTPATLIWDVPSEFPPSGDPNDPREPYKPVNYDGRFHGPVTVRTALANSYNIPAVKTLDFVGIYDKHDTAYEDGILYVARKMGITSLTRPDYGLSLTLGGGEVSLLELTGAYAVLANGGNQVPPIAILRILDHKGNIVYEYQPAPGDQVIRAEHAYLMSSILSDNEARRPMFGDNSIINLPFQAAAKTGTTNDFRDNWTMGYTPDLTVGVWIGNADYTPMQNISGITGAAPIWAEFMKYAVQEITGGNPTAFTKPSGVVDRVICSISGTEPSEWCTSQRSEVFAADQLPLASSQDLWSKVVFDTWTGQRASSACADFTKEEFAINVTDIWAIGWIQNSSEGKAWAEGLGFEEPFMFAPSRECTASDPRPVIEISTPTEGQTITTSPLDIIGRVEVPVDFKNFEVEYGIGDDPAEWIDIYAASQPVSQPGKIYAWDISTVQPGVITLRITMNSIRGGYAERKIHLNIQVATPTMTVTPSPTMTPSPTPSVSPTYTPIASQTPVGTPNRTPTYTQPPGSGNP